MQHVDYLTVAQEALQEIKKGAFLTVQAADKVNVMTIGWASIGFQWGRPVMSVMVRSSRYTFTLIEQSTEFTVAIPEDDMKGALDICGSKSGKKIDKLKAANIELRPGEKVKTPLVKLKGLNFECGIVYKSAINPGNLSESYTHLYPEKDYHTLYFGEIKYCYKSEG